MSFAIFFAWVNRVWRNAIQWSKMIQMIKSQLKFVQNWCECLSMSFPSPDPEGPLVHQNHQWSLEAATAAPNLSAQFRHSVMKLIQFTSIYINTWSNLPGHRFCNSPLASDDPNDRTVLPGTGRCRQRRHRPRLGTRQWALRSEHLACRLSRAFQLHISLIFVFVTVLKFTKSRNFNSSHVLTSFGGFCVFVDVIDFGSFSRAFFLSAPVLRKRQERRPFTGLAPSPAFARSLSYLPPAVPQSSSLRNL